MTGRPLVERVARFSSLAAYRGDVVLHRVVENGAWLLAANGVTAGLGALQALIVARALGVGAFGSLGLIVTFVAVLSRLTSFRMNEFVIQYLGRSDARGGAKDRAVVKFSLVVEAAAALLAFGIVWLLAPLGARFVLRDPGTVGLIRLYGMVVVVGLSGETATGVLQAYGRFPVCSAAGSLGAGVSLAGAAVAIALGGGLPGVLTAMVAGALAGSIVLSTNALREVRRRLGRDWWAARLDSLAGVRRSIQTFLLSTNASATLSLINRDGDLLWLGLFRGTAEAGLYRLAQSLAGLVLLPVAPLAQSIYPEVAREAAHRRWRHFGRLVRRGSLLAAAYVVPAAAVAVAISAPLISLLYGPQFAPAAPALIILLAGIGFSHVFFWARPALLALQRPDYPMKVNLALAALKVPAIILVIPAFGYIGSAALLALAYVGGSALCVWTARQIVRGEQRAAA